ncbi:MAG: ATP-binding protein [Thermoplasmata archaeon]|nr:ATP-binding protein [Thermoplasmata archaeon]
MEKRPVGNPFQRPLLGTLLKRLKEPRRFIQVLSGPRQVGKTTLAQQGILASEIPAHYASADEPGLRDSSWIAQEWEVGRRLAPGAEGRRAILVLDEVQKVPAWSDITKKMWDEDSRAALGLHVVLLGSAQLLVQHGLSESLAGRFEIIPVPHWSLPEMRDAFHWSTDQFVFYGGYPGAAPLVTDPTRWSRYILDSIAETTISRDVLLMSRVDKPALLRQLFRLGCEYSGQILSFQKMMGQLPDAGNTTTLAHYLQLLTSAGMLTGLQKYSGSKARIRGSIPKMQVLNTGLMTAPLGLSLEEAKRDPALWGRIVETAVGAHLWNTSVGTGIEVGYWREGDREVGYVLSRGRSRLAVEVKSGGARTNRSGLAGFEKRYGGSRQLVVGAEGWDLTASLAKPAEHWLKGT